MTVRAYTRANNLSFEWSFQWKITLMMCVSKLESWMLIIMISQIQILVQRWIPVKFHSNQLRILRVYAKTSKSSVRRRSLRDLCICAHMCLYTNLFLSRIRILKNCNHHSSYEFSLMCKVRSFLRQIAIIITMIIQVTNILSCVTALSLQWFKGLI